MPAEEQGVRLEPQTDTGRALVDLKPEVGVEAGIEEARAGIQERAQAAIRDQLVAQSAAILCLKPKLDQLREVAGERFMEPEAVFEILERIGLCVPPEERLRMLAEFEAELKSDGFEAFIAGSRVIRAASERQAEPLITKLPRVVIPQDAGEVKVFSIEVMCEAMQRAKMAGSIGKPMWLSSHVTGETKTKPWDSALRTWTSTCLEDSKNRRYRGEGGQLEHQKQVLGEGHKIHADMILAMAFRYIQTHGRDEIMFFRQDRFMRLNDADSVGYPLGVNVGDSGLALGDSGGGADPYGGIGGSLRISS